MSIEIGRLGRVERGRNVGWFILVEDDTANTGGYLVLKGPTPTLGYDDWVENFDALKGYFEESAWIIHWEESLPHSPE